ncbi:MAG: type IV secretory system conjugative DNA transfer family protein [Alphaproteobacteria bacterium]|nr:type IV secretory system conjugative DNA transfer family protein [Alphaproteobacteria bacterium]MBU2041359.1 type IV secretory system conjugative DNA transfer family protein [Alphaproteobacteria bacterium]MBU2125388.1 type IV secretory system conjugative DNA transfer family protein [Alphaproteobacteria bacterium]MBU2209550.1 type IV secretory system conjugative DNA transfer family protein [Alphaproteobacteria bacterium]MBU2290012.1 type IV secretory system conjugative DNA transfer family pro
MASWGNLANWLSGDSRSRELRDTRQAWAEVEALWRASPLVDGLSDVVLDYMREGMRRTDRLPALPILIALADATEDILRAEDIQAAEATWTAIDNDVEVASNFRQMLVRRKRWAANFEQMTGIARTRFLDAYDGLFRSLPEAGFGAWRETEDAFGVPLIELLESPADAIHHLVLFPYDDDTMRLGLFLRLREQLATNMLVASGFRPDDNIHERADRLVPPQAQKGKSPSELARMYLAGTPLLSVLELPVPFHIPEEARFEHCHIVGGTGHGKTQLMQRMIHADLAAAQRERRSVVVIDSQGDLINKLVRLALFDPDAPDSLADRLVLIDPADIEFPAALNLFDAHLERLQGYRAVDRERVLNGVIELYEVFFGAMLGAELTQKQGVIFRYLARLMVTIPGATIHTLMRLMEDGKPFKPHMEKLEGSARYFFETEFFHPSFAATKKQILKRLWGVLSTPAFERMFAQEANKLDLFEAMNDGKIILVSTAKDLLKSDGSALLGRFFITMLAQAALERSTIPAEDRTPTFVYVDEAQEYFDDSIETILNQARKYRVGLTLAHQTLDQLSPRLRSAIHSNTSLKCVGGVSAKDARALADELHTTSDFIESMKRRRGRSEFAVWLKQMTPQAIRLSVPLGFLERQPLLTEEALEEVLDANRERYCGTLDDVLGLDLDPSIAPASPEVSAEQTRPLREERPREELPEEPPYTPEPRASAPRPSPAPRELGKGGSQHRYVQHLVKGLAEERGFRAVIEEAVEGGQIDVALYRDDLSIACEISVTSTPQYEAQNLAKCSQGRFSRVFAIAADAKRLKAIETAAKARLSDEEMGCIDFLTPEHVAAALDAFAGPSEEASVVRGYRVKVSRTIVGADEARDRRSAIARVISQSMRGMPTDG